MSDLTRSEAIEELKEMRTDAWTDTRQMKSLEMAINILRSIEDIKAEIEEKRDLLMKQGGVYEHSAYGLDYAILIIDGHIEKENE